MSNDTQQGCDHNLLLHSLSLTLSLIFSQNVWNIQQECHRGLFLLQSLPLTIAVTSVFDFFPECLYLGRFVDEFNLKCQLRSKLFLIFPVLAIKTACQCQWMSNYLWIKCQLWSNLVWTFQFWPCYIYLAAVSETSCQCQFDWIANECIVKMYFASK